MTGRITVDLDRCEEKDGNRFVRAAITNHNMGQFGMTAVTASVEISNGLLEGSYVDPQEAAIFASSILSKYGITDNMIDYSFGRIGD